ncbi:copper radical oxidase [Boletus edulis]|nr:copper radical oxidase [Boletus edulis]
MAPKHRYASDPESFDFFNLVISIYSRHSMSIPIWRTKITTFCYNHFGSHTHVGSAITNIIPNIPSEFSWLNLGFCSLAPWVDYSRIMSNGSKLGSMVSIKRGQVSDTTNRVSMATFRLLTSLSLLTLIAQVSVGDAATAPTIKKTNLPGGFQYQGCLAQPSTTMRVLPYVVDYPKDNTVSGCLTRCADYGHSAAGVSGEQCFCGDVADVNTNGGKYVAESDCHASCSGDATELCGGVLRLTTYYWKNVYVFNAPENTGSYQFLIGGPMVPLIATVGINNKVSFLQKFPDNIFKNSTGAYELDISLAGDIFHAWRAMHVKSDIFCSASLVLPDKGARQINIGGWTDYTTGIRFYTPDGSAGVNGTNDWQENAGEVQLQRGRWYPTAMMMPNGSILVVGGQNGPGGPAQPSLELLPRTAGGDTTITLPYLQATNPNNLYPFLLTMPSGRIFIGYFNQARLLDPVTFNTVVMLPNMPGLVNDTTAGRNYPESGAAVLLPQHAPYTAPLEVLVCGGAASNRVSINNCIRMAPDVPNPAWTVERMPSGRVMPCMVTLPDGTYLILNGAQFGLAGFGQAINPNYNALLYNPSMPVGQRFSILASSPLARLYHSEATLLPDGRVLVSGSDPQTAAYPEEFRIEVYIPSYLSAGLKQPIFTIPVTDWAYGGQYMIHGVTLYQGGAIRISLIAASSSTHGNVMSGGRILFPAFNCGGGTCTITAPPNANVSPPSWYQLFVLDGPTPSHSAWVRIGGDPGKLGEWPPFPDFTKPGS